MEQKEISKFSHSIGYIQGVISRPEFEDHNGELYEDEIKVLNGLLDKAFTGIHNL